MNKNKTLLYILIVLAVIITAGAVYFTVDKLLNKAPAATSGVTEQTSRFNIIDEAVEAREIQFQDMEGNTHSLSEYRGMTVIVNFWAVFCGPCVEELPDFNRAVSELEAMNTIIIAINIVEPKSEIEEFITNLKVDELDFYMDINGNSSQTYAVATIPRTLIIDKDGFIRAAATGAVTYEDLIYIVELIN